MFKYTVIAVIFLSNCCHKAKSYESNLPSHGKPQNKRPNILIILADDLGWGDVSFHGSKQIPTPNIDLLASSGVILNNFYVSPICSPSRSALLTGYHPIRSGMQVNVLASSQPYGLPLHFRTLGHYFQDIGYSTHLVGKWHQGLFTWNHLPTRRGFDTSFGYLTGHSDYYNRTAGDRFHGYDFREGLERADLSKYEDQYSTDLYTDRVVKLIREHTGSEKEEPPFLIYFAQQSVHTGTFETIQPPKRFVDKFKWIADKKRRKFAGVVAALDESVGRVFQALNESGQLDDTIILFSNDNGGATGNGHGQFIDNSIGSNHPLKGSKYTLWEGGVRGTTFMWSSKLQPHVSNQLMHITDVLPTLYSAAGGQTSKLGPIDGVDQWQTLLNHTNAKEFSARSHLLHNIDHQEKFWAVRQANFKLTSGTWNKGSFDRWYTAPGQKNETPPNDIDYKSSEVFRVLSSRGEVPSKIVKIEIDCRADSQAATPCHANGQNNDNGLDFCLFDLDKDPCEMTNIASSYPDVAKQLFQLYEQYNKTYAHPENKPRDPESAPQLHGGWITPWIESLPAEQDWN